MSIFGCGEHGEGTYESPYIHTPLDVCFGGSTYSWRLGMLDYIQAHYHHVGDVFGLGDDAENGDRIVEMVGAILGSSRSDDDLLALQVRGFMSFEPEVWEKGMLPPHATEAGRAAALRILGLQLWMVDLPERKNPESYSWSEPIPGGMHLFLVRSDDRGVRNTGQWSPGNHDRSALYWACRYIGEKYSWPAPLESGSCHAGWLAELPAARPGGLKARIL